MNIDKNVRAAPRRSSGTSPSSEKKAQKIKRKTEYEISCYENENGEICLAVGEAEISFSKKRFLEFADKINQVSRSVLREILPGKRDEKIKTGLYRI